MMATIKFKKAAIPTLTRSVEREPNPYQEACDRLAQNRDDALSFSISNPDPDELRKAVDKANRQLTDCGRNGGYTVRRIRDGVGTDTQTITFWVVDKITHKPHARNK